MWNEIISLAIESGLWAVLFLGLFVFVIKDSSKREKKYQQTIKDLTDHLGVIKQIRNDIDDIKTIVYNEKNCKKSEKNAKNTQKRSKKQQNAQILAKKMEKVGGENEK